MMIFLQNLLPLSILQQWRLGARDRNRDTTAGTQQPQQHLSLAVTT